MTPEIKALRDAIDIVKTLRDHPDAPTAWDNLLESAENVVKSDSIVDLMNEWAANPDRMGGQFTEEELNRSGWL